MDNALITPAKAQRSRFQNVLGVVLAGGLSRRMGSGDKAFADLDGKPLISHVLESLKPQVKSLIISSNADPAAFAGFDAPVLADCLPGRRGPLAGLLTALEYARRDGSFDAVASVAADTPFLPHNFVKKLKSHKKYDIVLASSNGRVHFACGLWALCLAPGLRRFLTHCKTRQVMSFVEKNCWHVQEFAPDHRQAFDPFFNINTPQDLLAARAWLKSQIKTAS